MKHKKARLPARLPTRQARQGFTLIELLIVIAVIAIIAAVVFVALDPLTRFRDARDSSRWSDISAILSASKLYQVDNNGSFLDAIDNMVDDQWHMIVDGDMDLGCDDQDATTGTDCDIGADTYCVDLAGLVTAGYLGDVPISPEGVVAWDDGSEDTEEGTGYALFHDTSTGALTVMACEAEGTTDTITLTQ